MRFRKNKQPSSPLPEKQALSLRDAMNRLFEESFWEPSEFLSDLEANYPKTDIMEDEKEIKVIADVPGIDPEKIEIEAEEDSLSLSGKTEKEEEQKDKKFYRYERSYGQFRRSFPLPSKVDPEKVSAKVKNGVLTVTLPKTDQGKRKRIEIEKE